MGAGIAQLGSLADVPTPLFDASSEALGRADERITKGLDHGVERGRWAASGAAGAKQRLTLAELQSCELVIEAVVEDLDIKAEVLGQLGSRPFIATNTSFLSVTEIAARAHRPERVVGMHFFNPPPLMRLVEVIPGIQTSGETLAAAFPMATARLGRAARQSIPRGAAPAARFGAQQTQPQMKLAAQQHTVDATATAGGPEVPTTSATVVDPRSGGSCTC